MATFYVSQAGAGTKDGSSAANAIDIGSVSYANDNTYWFLGTITTTIDFNTVRRAILRGDDVDDPCTLSGITGNGIYTHGGSGDIEITGFTINNCSTRGIYCVESGLAHTYFKIHDNIVRNCGSFALRCGASVGGSLCNGVEVYDNTFTDNAIGLYFVDCPSLIVRNNTLNANGTAGAGNTDGIGVDDGCDNALVEFNVITGNKSLDGAGIDIQNSIGTGTSIVRGNLVIDPEGFGLHHVGIEDAQFHGNVALGGRFGLFVKSGDGPSSPTTCDFFNNLVDRGLKIGGTSIDNEEITLDLKNNIILFEGDDAVWVDSDVGLTVTSSYNCFGDSPSYTNFTKDATDLEVAPDLDANYVAQHASLVGGGTRWWAGTNPVGQDGEPFADWSPSIGGLQSREIPFHPVNL